MKQIPYGRQSISDEDIEAVLSVLRSDYLTQGPAVPTFEGALLDACGVDHAVVVNSATSALHIACLALGVEIGDLVWTSSISFVASANCARYCGANVDFLDIDPSTFNISIEKLSSKLVEAKKINKLPKVLIAVHMAGQPCDMEGIHRLANEYGFKVIEDASHAVGAKFHGQAVGSCEFSDITVLSFHPVKIVTTGEGGAALTNNKALADRMRLLRSHGITRVATEFSEQSQGDWYYEQKLLGYNYRMTDLQAALGVSQLRRLEEFVNKREEIAITYSEKLDPRRILLPKYIENSRSAWHLYIVQVDASIRDVLFSSLRSLGIQVNMHYLPIYRHPYYAHFDYRVEDFPNAENYFKSAISLPIFPSISNEDLGFVIEETNHLVSTLI